MRGQPACVRARPKTGVPKGGSAKPGLPARSGRRASRSSAPGRPVAGIRRRLPGGFAKGSLISEETIRELLDAPEAVRSFWEGLPDHSLERVAVDDEAKDLADRYIRAGVLGAASASDALHVATASVAGAELILSWNFRHIVNFNRIKGFNGVNVMNGYPLKTILCPLEVGNDD